MNWIRRIALFLGIVLLPIGAASITAGAAAPASLHAGDLDPTFGTGGKVVTDFGGSEFANAVAIQTDGRIVVAGQTATDLALARYKPDGGLDPSFGTGGKVTTGGQDFADAVAIQPNGKIVVAGGNELIRYNADGSLDSSFGTGGKVTTDFAAPNNIFIVRDSANSSTVPASAAAFTAVSTGTPDTIVTNAASGSSQTPRLAV